MDLEEQARRRPFLPEMPLGSERTKTISLYGRMVAQSGLPPRKLNGAGQLIEGEIRTVENGLIQVTNYKITLTPEEAKQAMDAYNGHRKNNPGCYLPVLLVIAAAVLVALFN